MGCPNKNFKLRSSFCLYLVLLVSPPSNHPRGRMAFVSSLFIVCTVCRVWAGCGYSQHLNMNAKRDGAQLVLCSAKFCRKPYQEDELRPVVASALPPIQPTTRYLCCCSMRTIGKVSCSYSNQKRIPNPPANQPPPSFRGSASVSGLPLTNVDGCVLVLHGQTMYDNSVCLSVSRNLIRNQAKG